jgi:large subunit ribosomal protein L13Ae
LHATLHFNIDLTTLQRLSHEVGWGYKDVVDRLEEKRKIKAQAYFERKVGFSQSTQPVLVLIGPFKSAALKLRQKAIADAAPSFEKLTALGY